MKKLGFILAVAIGFSSCKMADNLQVEKRHYGKGYYVHMRDNHSDAVVAENKTPVLSSTENPAVVNTDEGTVTTIEKSTVTAQTKSSILEPRAATKTSRHQSVLTKPENKSASPVKNKVEKIIAVTKKTSSEPAGDVSMLILVILAIFISPLAVFLKEGVTNRFWLDLVCWIIGGGFFLTPFFYGGFLLLFAVVFALLIVLDAI